MFVESVKPNGAAHKAGLIASDMILEASFVALATDKLIFAN